MSAKLITQEDLLMKKRILSLLSFVAAMVLVACSQPVEEAQKETIRYGSTPGPYSELFLEEVAPQLEEQGYTIENQSFSDVLSVNTAMNDGQLDLNIDQHLLYMNFFNEESGATLTSLGEVPTVPAALFPARKASLEEVESGDQIGVPEDPSNLTRALLLLEKAGWIALDPSVNAIDMTEDDIVENIAGIEIVTMASATIPRSLEDLDYAVIPGFIAYDTGISFQTALVYEDVLPELMLQAVVPAENADKQWAKDLIEIYHSEEFATRLAELNEERGETYWIVPSK